MTDHFFEPGAEYDDATGYSAPELIRTFRCVAVAAMPDTGEPVAFGFMRHARMQWFGTGMGIDHWRQGWNRTSPRAEPEPSDGLKALAEANGREKAWQAAEVRPEPDTLPKLVSRLREHGLDATAEFFESVEPAEPREHAVSAGSSYRAGSTCAGCSAPMGQQEGDPDDTPQPTLDQEAYLGGREKRTPQEWCDEYGVDIRDPDGWRGRYAPSWDEPIALDDFRQRAARSTLNNAVLVDWKRILRDAGRMPEAWKPCPDCNDPLFCEKSDTELCP